MVSFPAILHLYSSSYLCSEIIWPALLLGPSLIFVLGSMAYQLCLVCVDQLHLAELALLMKLASGMENDSIDAMKECHEIEIYF